MKLRAYSTNVEGMHHAIWPDLFKLDTAWREWVGTELLITYAKDGKHSATSRHYLGTAVDVRTWTNHKSEVQISGSQRRTLLEGVRKLLGEDWFILDEKTHFHLDYRPRYKQK